MKMTSLFLTLSAFAISANAVPPLISEMVATTGIEAPNFGFFIFIQYVAFSMVAFSGGYLKKKWRISNYLIVAIGLGCITFSLISGGIFLHSYLSLLIWVIPLGLSGGAVETFASIEISNLSSFDSSKNLCLSQVFYSLGAFSAPQIVYFCLGFDMGWKSIFFIFSVISLLAMIFFLFSNRHRLKLTQSTNELHLQTKEVNFKSQNGQNLFILLLLIMICYVIIESLSAAWLSYIFKHKFHLTTKDAALALAAFWAGVTSSRLIIVLLPSRLTLWPTILVSSVLLSVATIVILLAPGHIASIIAVGLMGVAAGPIWPVIIMISSSVFRSDKKTAIIIGMGALGFAVGPLLGSLIINAGSIQMFHYTQILVSLLLLLLIITAYFVNGQLSNAYLDHSKLI
ncbi:MAG: MFS transporter [Deltaproteobacteria bacterium]|jgi:fucose permease|nr:MFS transporter [Deltaproteobacteria bacterium]